MINATMNNLFTAQEIEEAINTLATLKRYMSGGGVDIKANKAIDMAIEVLKAPPITQRRMYQLGYRQAQKDRLKGEWIYSVNDESVAEIWDCSECGQWSLTKTNYCPNCGADMRKDETDES